MRAPCGRRSEVAVVGIVFMMLPAPSPWGRSLWFLEHRAGAAIATGSVLFWGNGCVSGAGREEPVMTPIEQDGADYELWLRVHNYAATTISVSLST